MLTRSRSLYVISRRAYNEAAAAGVRGTSASANPTGVNPNVPGLSNRVVKPSTGKLGPGASASGEYKVPEYYSFNRFSYAEAEVEMAKFRLPQPSAVKK